MQQDRLIISFSLQILLKNINKNLNSGLSGFCEHQQLCYVVHEEVNGNIYFYRVDNTDIPKWNKTLETAANS